MSEALVQFLEAGLLQPVFVFVLLFGTAAQFRRRGVDAVAAIGAALAAIGLAAFAVFWLAWWWLPGRLIVNAGAILAIVAAVASTILAVRRGQLADEIAMPIAVAFVATLALLLWAYLGQDPAAPLSTAAIRWTHQLPGDNAIPLEFARAMATGHLPIGRPSPNFGEWQASDRPPLQTALFLLTPGHWLWKNSEQAYQTAGVAFQMLALIGAWALARSIGADRRIALAAMVAVFFAPITLVNGAYVWPKLIAAAFLLVAAAIHFSPDLSETRPQTWYGALVGSLVSLSMLSHGGSAFAMIGIAAATIILGRLGTPLYVAAALVALAISYAPWVAYQKFVDPPGNRLLKWHLAGVIPVDPRGLWRTIEDSYRAKSWDQLIAAREANFSVVIDPGGPVLSGTLAAARDVVSGQLAAAKAALKPVRVTAFFMFVPGTGFLGFALYLLPIGLLDRQTRAITLTLILSLVVWIGLMFLPANTVIHQGSMFPEIALIVVALAFAAKRSQPVAIGLIALQTALTGFQYAL